jgi:PleD family two-component response regulator
MVMMDDVRYVDSDVFPVAKEETILVIDACSRDRARVVEGLILCGFRVASAASVQEAFYAAISLRPDLILVAMALPSSSAVELARSLKHDARLRDIPLVTYGDASVADALDAEPSRFAVQPIRAEELVSALRARIASPRSIRKAHARDDAPTLRIARRG